MPRNIVKDVVPGKRSIRDVSLPPRRRQPEPPVSNDTEKSEEDLQEDNGNIPRVPRRPLDYDFDYDVERPKKGKRWGLWSLVIIFVLALGFGISSIFTSAEVSVLAKSQSVPVQNTFSAPINPPAGVFGYQIVSVSTSTQREVTAGAQTQVDKKATGTIVIYNSSGTVQNLRATTRFATPDGLIFRIDNAVSVPKATTSGGQTVPGSVTTTVTADQSGDKYNIGLSDFTVPGLAGTSQATAVYGRSKTAMSGGFSGMMSSVDQATLTQAKSDLDSALKGELQN